MANSLAAYVTKFTNKLDETVLKDTCTADLNMNQDLLGELSGAGEIKVAKMALSGLADHTRGNGFTRGSINIDWETLKLAYDRDREFSIDSLDDEELDAVVSANVMKEFAREEVVPEVDAIRFAKLAAKSGTTVAKSLSSADDALAAILTAEEAIEDLGGDLSKCLLYCTSGFKTLLRNGTVHDINNFIDVISYDMHVAKPGILRAGESYMYCYISSCELAEYQHIDGYANLSLTVLSDNPVWIRKSIATLTQRTSKPVDGLNYPYNYPYNYLMSNDENASVTNPFQLPAKCNISFSGPCVSPYVIIGRNRYQVLGATASKGQLIIIRGFGTKDIVVKDIDGSETSIFELGVRKQNAHCFAEIPVGENTASWPGTPNIEISIYEERMSPWQI